MLTFFECIFIFEPEIPALTGMKRIIKTLYPYPDGYA